MNRRTKFDAASFVLDGEVRNRTNKHTQTVNDRPISTPRLSACVNNKYVCIDVSDISEMSQCLSRSHLYQ